MAEEVGWGALGNAQGGWFAGAGLWVGEEQVIAPVVGVSEVRNKIYWKGLWGVPGLRDLKKESKNEGQNKAETSGKRRPMAGAAMLAHLRNFHPRERETRIIRRAVVL